MALYEMIAEVRSYIDNNLYDKMGYLSSTTYNLLEDDDIIVELEYELRNRKNNVNVREWFDEYVAKIVDLDDDEKEIHWNALKDVFNSIYVTLRN